MVVRGPLYLDLLPVVLLLATRCSCSWDQSSVKNQHYVYILVFPLITMAMIPAALLPRWCLIELDDWSSPLPPGYKQGLVESAPTPPSKECPAQARWPGANEPAYASADYGDHLERSHQSEIATSKRTGLRDKPKKHYSTSTP